MRSIRLSLGLGAALFVLCFSRIAMADETVTKTFTQQGYERLEVDFPFVVEIQPGRTHRAVVTIDQRLASCLEVIKRGTTLYIGLTSGCRSGDGQHYESTFSAQVTMPRLTGLSLNTASQARIAPGFKYVKAFELELNSASQVKGELKVGRLNLNITAASVVQLNGSAKTVDLDLSAASHAKLGQFTIGDARVEVSGASNARLFVKGSLEAEVSGVSTLSYTGNPTIRTLDSSGMSHIRRF